MADDHNARYRSIDPSNRGPDMGAAPDPLAELARLIGQAEPAATTPRPTPARDTSFQSSTPGPRVGSDPGYHYGAGAAQQYGTPPAYSPDPTPRYAAEPAPQYNPEPTPRYSPEPAPRYNPEPAPRYGAEQNQRYADDPRTGWPGSPSPAYPPPPDPFAMLASARRASQPQPQSSQPFDSRDFPDPRYRPEGDAASFEQPGYPADSGQPTYPQDADGGRMPSPHGDEFYDDAPRGDRRKGLMTVAAVLGLAVLGTAAAFGYRSVFGGSHSSAPPPVIHASGEPSKVAPPPMQADSSANKFSYDRFGDRGKDEQMVVREEKPVDTSALAGRPEPRTVFPGAPFANTAPPQTGSSAPSALGEPKRVRTVQIRPDQPEPSTTPQTVSAAPQNPLPPTVSQSTQAVPPVAARASSPRRVATRTAAPPPAPTENAPLSLSPNGEPAANNFPPPPRAAAPARLASVPASGGAGGYVVQVSSQRSEAEAQSAYRSIHSKYSSVLGSQPHTVKRADLGSRGIYYRAMVGPFGSRDQAIQLCSSLKAAGGACVVQSN